MTPHECILACHALASSGHLEEAKATLRRNSPCLKSEEGIDLLARIELALGNEGEARRLWDEAAKSGVGGAVSRKALDALGSVGWRHRAIVRLLGGFLRFAAVLAIGVAIGCWVGSCGSAPNVPVADVAEIASKPSTPIFATDADVDIDATNAVLPEAETNAVVKP